MTRFRKAGKFVEISIWSLWGIGFTILLFLSVCTATDVQCDFDKSEGLRDNDETFCYGGGNSASNYQFSESEYDPISTSQSQPSRMVIDSIDSLWGLVDTDDNGFLTEEEISVSIRAAMEQEIDEEEADSITHIAKMILDTLDENVDTVVTVYELQFGLEGIGKAGMDVDESFKNYQSVLFKWMKECIDKAARKIPLHLVKLYQLFDEDLNGKLSGKEMRMVIKTVEKFNEVPKSLGMNNAAMERLFHEVDNDGSKWLNMEEFLVLLSPFEINVLNDDDPSRIYKWMIKFLEGNSEYALASESTCKEFEQYDLTQDGIMSKGELIAALHSHRKDYYTEARINRRFTRSDRNADGKISFNEYVFLEDLKNRKK